MHYVDSLNVLAADVRGLFTKKDPYRHNSWRVDCRSYHWRTD